MKTLASYTEDNKLLAHQIIKAEEMRDFDMQIELKRKYHTNKLLMIDLIDTKNTKLSISAKELFEKVKKLKPAIRYETGLEYFDRNLKGGFEVGSLIILGGESGAGKSHIMLDLLSNISNYSKVMFFNFEMGDRRLTHRLKKSLTSQIQQENFIINADSRDLEDLIMEIKLKADEGVVFFAIDSRMKITVKGSEAEYQKIASVTKRLSEIAIRLDIIIFLINQISEENLKTKTLAFKGSGDQLYDADMALFLVIEKINDEERRRLICKKNRQDEFQWNEILPRLIVVEETQYKETPKIEMSIL